ncbi:MAG: hypothetical protein WCH99_10230 [Verrucomicrobiota bacterium]
MNGTPAIHRALCNGGKLFFKQLVPNKLIISAHICFTDGAVVKGKPSTSLSGAIENLEAETKKEIEVQS